MMRFSNLAVTGGAAQDGSSFRVSSQKTVILHLSGGFLQYPHCKFVLSGPIQRLASVRSLSPGAFIENEWRQLINFLKS